MSQGCNRKYPRHVHGSGSLTSPIMPATEGDTGLLPLLKSRTFLLLQARGTAAGVGYTVYLATVLWLSFRLTNGIFLAGVVVGV